MTSDRYNTLLSQYAALQGDYKRSSDQYQAEDVRDRTDSQSRSAQMGEMGKSYSDHGIEGMFKAGLSGLSAGMDIGDKRERRDKKSKFDEVTSYWDEQNRSIKEKLSKIQAEEDAKIKMRPYMSAYLKSMDKMDATTRRTEANKLIGMSNKMLGNDVVVDGVDGENPAIWNMKDKETGELIAMDMGIMFAGDAVSEQELAYNQTSSALDRQGQRQKAAADKVEDDRNYNLKAKDINYKVDPVKQGEAAFMKEKQKTLGSKVFEYKQSLLSTHNIMDRLQRMDSAVKNNLWVFNIKERNLAKWLTINPENAIMTFKEEYARFSLDSKEIEVIKKLSKEYNNILYDKVNRQNVGRVTDKMLAMDQKGLPLPWEMSEESYFETIKELTSEYNNEAIHFAEEIVYSDNQFKRLSGGSMMTFSDGSSRFIPSDEIEAAEKLGAKHG